MRTGHFSVGHKKLWKANLAASYGCNQWANYWRTPRGAAANLWNVLTMRARHKGQKYNSDQRDMALGLGGLEPGWDSSHRTRGEGARGGGGGPPYYDGPAP